MSKCANCQQNIPEGSEFCPNCGQGVLPLAEARCPQCHGVISTGAKYCHNCGYTLGDAVPQAAPPPAVAPGSSNNRTYYDQQAPRPAGAGNYDKRRKDRSRIVAIIAIVVVIAVIVIAVQSALFHQSSPDYMDASSGDAYTSDSSTSDSDTSGVATADSSAADTTTAGPAPAALPYPESGYIFYGWSEDNECPLTIDTEGDQAYFVKLETLTGEDVFAFFVQPGDTVDVVVPLGTYMMKYAAGTDWYGSQYLFGEDTVYTKADDNFEFTYSNGSYNGWTVTFYTVVDGNLSTEAIGAGEF
jgi:RNA polymerase subunit RPABC4/transcription elongation factor Spt4